jgi:hypothetical protein
VTVETIMTITIVIILIIVITIKTVMIVEIVMTIKVNIELIVDFQIEIIVVYSKIVKEAEKVVEIQKLKIEAIKRIIKFIDILSLNKIFIFAYTR